MSYYNHMWHFSRSQLHPNHHRVTDNGNQKHVIRQSDLTGLLTAYTHTYTVDTYTVDMYLLLKSCICRFHAGEASSGTLFTCEQNVATWLLLVNIAQ